MGYGGPEKFEEWFRDDAAFWADPTDEDYMWPLRSDAPIEMVIAYLEYVTDKMKDRLDLTVSD